MPQDFAKTRPPTKKKKARKKSFQSDVPVWVWVFTGIVAGAFGMFLIYLAGLTPTVPKPSPTVENTTDDSSALQGKAKPIFEFYDRLMNKEVIVDVTPDDSQQNQTPTVYILQAASFQKPEEADSLKALLILEGLDVSIEEVVNKGDTWHRVLVGPFNSRSKMASARSKLAQHEISPIVLKQKPEEQNTN